jgi:hypothetical protein
MDGTRDVTNALRIADRADGRGYRGLTRVGARFAQWAGR